MAESLQVVCRVSPHLEFPFVAIDVLFVFTSTSEMNEVQDRNWWWASGSNYYTHKEKVPKRVDELLHANSPTKNRKRREFQLLVSRHVLCGPRIYL